MPALLYRLVTSLKNYSKPTQQNRMRRIWPRCKRTLKRALDTAKTWTLQNAFGDNLRVV
jgi:hypothetical protein